MRPVGYIELIERFGLETLAPESRSYVLERGHRRSVIRDGHRDDYYPAQAYPGASWTDHLTFALKREGLNLEVLAALFAVVPTDELTDFVRRSPNGRYARLAWFLFEWLTGTTLPMSDLTQGNYFSVLDPDLHLAVGPTDAAARVRRQRVVNNLPGTPAYCPLVRRTAILDGFIEERLEERVRRVLDRYPSELVIRAAQYLFVKETKSSYQIEGLQPDQRRTARFVELLRRAGSVDCATEDELTVLQRLIVDQRYAAEGFRQSQNYVGQSLGPGRELIHYVPPKPEDVRGLMSGWEECSRRLGRGGRAPGGRRRSLGIRLCLHPSFRGWERTSAPLSYPPRVGRGSLHPGGRDLSGVRGHAAGKSPLRCRAGIVLSGDHAARGVRTGRGGSAHRAERDGAALSLSGSHPGDRRALRLHPGHHRPRIHRRTRVSRGLRRGPPGAGRDRGHAGLSARSIHPAQSAGTREAVPKQAGAFRRS